MIIYEELYYGVTFNVKGNQLVRSTKLLEEDYTKSEQDELMLVNVIEELVKDSINVLIPTMDMCACEICKLNACAIALNNLTPRYVTTTKGKLMAKMPAEIMTYQTQILVEVTKALMTVKAHPLHD